MLNLFLIGLSLLAKPQAPSEVVHIYYLDKPPYSYVEDGKLKGFLVEKTEEILKKAKIAYVTDIRPAVRILKEIKDNNEAICSPGWFKTAERESYGWFTGPIYIDKPGVMVIHRDLMSTFNQMTSLEDLLQNKKLVLGLIEGASYGKFDVEVNKYKGITIKKLGDFQMTLKQLARRRIDWTVVNREEWDYFIEKNPSEASQLSLFKYPSVVPQGERHLFCNLGLSDQLKKKFNNAILGSKSKNSSASLAQTSNSEKTLKH